jgi:two-component system copper resistance phosphate regulon response regulator CusR
MSETLVEFTRRKQPVAVHRPPAPPHAARRRAVRQVLIIRDGEGGTSLAQLLREDGHAVEVAAGGSPVVDHIVDGAHYDLVVVDAPSGTADSLTIVRALREYGVDTPLMFLTTDDRVAARIAAFDTGADDVMTRPFASDEARARVRALLRRSAPPRPVPLQIADLTIDPATHMATRAGRRVALTPREFTLLEYFLRNVDRVLTRSMILAHVWGVGFDSANNLVEVYVGYLRRKVDAGHERRLLHTVRGSGYMLTVDG